MVSDEDHERAIEIIALGEHIKAVMAGRGPAVQSGVLAQLVAVYLAGFPTKAVRDEVLLLLLELINGMLEIELGHREDRDDGTQH